MRKLLSVLSSTLQGGVRRGLLFFALLATTTLWAYDFQSGDLYYNITSDTTVEVTYQYEWSSDNYAGLTTATIPETVTYNGTTYSVTSIGNYAFQYCTSLTSVTIPNSVASIGGSAFHDCSSLTSISIPNSVTSIGSWAFHGTGIYNEESNWENDVLYIDNCLIEARTSISGAYAIKENTRLIADYAFRDCSSLTSVTIPNSVTSIGYHAFYNCAFTKDNFINNSTLDAEKNNYWEARVGDTEIDGLLIKDDTILVACRPHLTSVTIPNSVTSIGNYAFYGCSSLTSVAIPNSVTSIGRLAFDGTGIYNEESNWENDVLYIDNCLIEARTSISGAYAIKENTRLIGNYAFEGCYSLTSVAIPNSVTTIGDYAFAYCYSLTSVTIPNGVTSIRNGAFVGCSSLTSITIPEGVTSIGNGAFGNCSSLKHVEWNVKNHTDFDYYNRPFDNQSSIQSFTFGENVEYIPADLCCNMDSLKTITIPNSVDSIGGQAFYSCDSLVLVTIGNSVTSIGDYAFAYCSSLTSITIPNCVTSIEGYAFYECSSLTSITIPEGVTSIGSGAFGNCSSLKHVEWNVKNHTDFDYYNRPFDDQSSISIQSFTFGENVEYIPAYLCYDMDSLKTITIPNSVDSIGGQAFYSCDSLVLVTIGNSVTSIGDYAFGNCSLLKYVEWNVKNYADFDYHNRPFRSSPAISSFTFGEDVEYIPAYLCYDMDSLKTITIPNSVDSIGGQAFYSCDSLVSVTIGNSVTSIGDKAFIYCDSLRFIFSAPLLPPAIESNVFSFNAYDNATLHVLSSDYKTHNVWKQFDSIQVADTIYSDGIRYKVINKSGELLSESLLTEESFNKFTRVSVEGDYTWRYDNPYGASMNAFQNETNATLPNEDWFISPALDLEGCSSATLTFSHAFGPKAQVPTSSSQKAQYTIWVSNDFEGDVASATWTQLSGMEYGSTAWEYISSGNITIPTENLKANCRVAWKYTCTTSSATWEIKDVSLFATIDTNAKPTLQVINGESPYSGDIVIPSIVKYMNTDLEVSSISNIAFRDCSSLNSVTVENGVTTIEEYAFYNSSLTSISLPNTLTHIGYSAFRGCSSLISIAIPNGVTTIRNNTFSGCSFLTSATISNGVMAIDKYAFADCLSLNTISVPNSVTRIGQSTFKNCTSLVEVTLSNEMNTLEKETFQDCSSLKFVRLGGKLTTIGESVFSACTALNEITLPASVKSIGENAFAGCNKLYDIYCYAMEPPTAYESSFANYNAFLHVPCDNQRVYLLDILFGNFKYVECIEAETAPTDTVVVTPSFNDAEFIWPSNSSADSYTLAISKDSEIFCTLTFNANGQLTGIAFAPSRNGQHNAPAAAQTANGFAFTVTGLDEGANYTYDLLIQDRSGNTLQSYSGEFRTQSTNDRTVTVEYDAAQGQVTGAGTYLIGDTVTLTAIPNDGYRFVRWSNEVEDNPYTFVISDNVTLSAEFEEVITTSVENTTPSQQSDTHKFLRDGQLLIIRDGKTYNAMGQEL